MTDKEITHLGNGIKHEATKTFIKSRFNLSVIDNPIKETVGEES